MVTIAHWGGILKRQVSGGCDELSEHWAPDDVEAVCRECGHVWRDRFWSPVLTIWTFLLQVLHHDSSCRAAVAMALSQQAAAGQRSASAEAEAAACHIAAHIYAANPEEVVAAMRRVTGTTASSETLKEARRIQALAQQVIDKHKPAAEKK